MTKFEIEYIHDKGTGAMNEDVPLIQEKLFGVFDGATSLNKYMSAEGKTGGLLAAEIARDTFGKKQGTLTDAAREANHQIKKAMLTAKIDISRGVNLWRSAAAVVEIKEDSFDWLVIADSVVLVINEDGSLETVVPFRDHDQKVMMKWKELAEKKVTNIREKLADELFKLRDESHPPYGVLSGDESMNKLFKFGELSLKGVKHILLFTDGLLLPSEDPVQPPNFKKLADLYLQGGLKEILGTVRNLEESDPYCWKYPRYKQHDDIAAIAITF